MTSAPSEVIFKLSDNYVAENVQLDPDSFRVLSFVNGLNTVEEISESLGEDPVNVWQILGALHQRGIVEILGAVDVVPNVAPSGPPPAVGEAFFARITQELTRGIGPLAAFFVEDELAAMSAKRDGLPRERAAELVERLSLSIQDDAKRVQFQQAALEELRRLY